jgi:hypothetical protein
MAVETKTFSINQSPIVLNTGDVLTFKFVLKGTTTNNFTASLSEGSLNVSSLAASTGYATTACNYFDSASVSASIVAGSGSTSTITFNPGISNFYGGNYIFAPNPLTGSQNSLYNTYGNVDYEFVVKPFDIAITYLSDNTYVESRILSSSYSGSLLQFTLDGTLSTLYKRDILSGSYQRFLVLSRKEDETNAYLTFRKREGATSYGFIIPSNLSADVLENIDTITREVKQKLLSDQSQVTINTF